MPVWKPAMQVMRRLSMGAKFAIVCAAFAVPLVYLLVTVYSDRREALDFSAKELIGIAQVQKINPLLGPAMAMRGQALGAATQAEGAQARRVKAKQDFDEQLKALQQLLTESGDPLQLRADVDKTRALADALAGLQPDRPEAALAAGNALTESVLALVSQAADASNLALDPDADSYYLMLLVTDTLPHLKNAVGQVRGLGAASARLGQPPVEVLMGFHDGGAVSEEYLRRTADALKHVLAANPVAGRALDADVPERVAKSL